MLELSYFASIREHLGSNGEVMELPAGVSDVSGLIDFLVSRDDSGKWEILKDESQVLVAVNQAVASRNTNLKGNEELAFFPPMTGG